MRDRNELLSGNAGANRPVERISHFLVVNDTKFPGPKAWVYPPERVTCPRSIALMTENRRILSVVAAVLLVCFIGPSAASADTTPPLPTASSTGPALAPSSQELAILRAVNGIRAAHGRRPLGLGPALHRAARAHSVDMVRRGYFDHGAFVQRLRSFGVRGRALGENLAYATEPGFNAGAVVRMWMTSPPHRSVLLDRSFSKIGVGVAGGLTRRVTADFAG